MRVDRLQAVHHEAVLVAGEQRVGQRAGAEERHGLDPPVAVLGQAAEEVVLVVGRAVADELRQGVVDRVRARRAGLRVERGEARERVEDRGRERRVVGAEEARAAGEQGGVDRLLGPADRVQRVAAVEGGELVAQVRAVGDERVDEVRPAVARRRGGEAHVASAGAVPGRVGQREPGEPAAVGAAGRDDLVAVDVEERPVVGEQPREVLVVVDLVAP